MLFSKKKIGSNQLQSKMLTQVPSDILNKICLHAIERDCIWAWVTVNKDFYQVYQKLKMTEHWQDYDHMRTVLFSKDSLNSNSPNNSCTLNLIQILLTGAKPGPYFISRLKWLSSKNLLQMDQIIYQTLVHDKVDKLMWLIGIVHQDSNYCYLETGITKVLEDHQDSIQLIAKLYTVEPFFQTRIWGLASYWKHNGIPKIFETSTASVSSTPVNFDDMCKNMVRTIYDSNEPKISESRVQSLKPLIPFPSLRPIVWVYVIQNETDFKWFSGDTNLSELSKFSVPCAVIKCLVGYQPTIRNSHYKMLTVLMEHVVGCERCQVDFCHVHSYASQICILLESSNPVLVEILLSCMMNVMDHVKVVEFYDHLAKMGGLKTVTCVGKFDLGPVKTNSNSSQPPKTLDSCDVDVWQAEIQSYNDKPKEPEKEVGLDMSDDFDLEESGDDEGEDGESEDQEGENGESEGDNE